jgi:hypothetical protein
MKAFFLHHLHLQMRVDVPEQKRGQFKGLECAQKQKSS